MAYDSPIRARPHHDDAPKGTNLSSQLSRTEAIELAKFLVLSTERDKGSAQEAVLASLSLKRMLNQTRPTTRLA